MAEFNKTQIKKMVRALLKKIEPLRDEIDDLRNDVEEESSNIEPYEGKDDLTPAQEARQEWLDNVASALGYIVDGMDTDELEGYMEE